MDARLAAARDDPHAVRQSGKRVSREIRGAPGDDDAAVRACGLGGRLARLGNGLVRDAAGIDDGDVACGGGFTVTVREQAPADRLLVGERHLAAEESCRERGHLAGM